MQIENNSILITGGGSGIGLAFAKELAERNNHVLICGRNHEKLTEAEKEHPNITSFVCDITQKNQRENMLKHITKNFCDINFLINNAAVYLTYDFLNDQCHSDRIDLEVATNLSAHMHLTDRLLPLLNRHPQAAIVNITSALARVLHPHACVYAATKAGLSMFSQTIRLQLKNTPVRVFEISPPLVDTAMCTQGQGKISPQKLVAEALHGIEKNKLNIFIGKTKLFYFLNALHPIIARKLIGRI